MFLVGAERSGTTVLRLMLDHHPELSWVQEFEYSVDMMSPEGAPPDLTEYHQWLGIHRIFRASGFSIDPSLSYIDLVRSFLEQRLRASGKRKVGATVHRHFDRLLKV